VLSADATTEGVSGTMRSGRFPRVLIALASEKKTSSRITDPSTRFRSPPRTLDATDMATAARSETSQLTYARLWSMGRASSMDGRVSRIRRCVRTQQDRRARA
jgi:hypothetical protein